MAPEPRIITVFGATGLQGSAVVRSLLKDQVSHFQVRAITRDPDSEKSQALRKLGVEVVKGNGWNKDDMQRAFSGSWGAFVNTNSDDPVSHSIVIVAKPILIRVKVFQQNNAPTEFDLGRTIIDGIVAAGVKNLVLSSMKPAAEATAGKMNIKTMDSKFWIP